MEKKAEQIKTALQQLAAQQGDPNLQLQINQMVSITNNIRNRYSREDVQCSVQVNIDTLEQVAVYECVDNELEKIVLCVRLIFDGQLYVCKQDSEKIIAWAGVCEKPSHDPEFRPFPSVSFEQAKGKVKVYRGEVQPA